MVAAPCIGLAAGNSNPSSHPQLFKIESSPMLAGTYILASGLPQAGGAATPTCVYGCSMDDCTLRGMNTDFIEAILGYCWAQKLGQAWIAEEVDRYGNLESIGITQAAGFASPPPEPPTPPPSPPPPPPPPLGTVLAEPVTFALPRRGASACLRRCPDCQLPRGYTPADATAVLMSDDCSGLPTRDTAWSATQRAPGWHQLADFGGNCLTVNPGGGAISHWAGGCEWLAAV
jgi:hypothetical protein